MITMRVTHEFIRLGSMAFGVDAAVHHDSDAAIAAGLRDIIMSTPHLGALVERFVLENWGTRVTDVRLLMQRPVVAGSTIVLAGAATYNGFEVTISSDERTLLVATCS